MAHSKTTLEGFQCPVRGCTQRKGRRFRSARSVIMHMEEKHPGEAEKRLRLKRSWQ